MPEHAPLLKEKNKSIIYYSKYFVYGILNEVDSFSTDKVLITNNNCYFY
jgi:hypothetical protein